VPVCGAGMPTARRERRRRTQTLGLSAGAKAGSLELGWASAVMWLGRSSPVKGRQQNSFVAYRTVQMMDYRTSHREREGKSQMIAASVRDRPKPSSVAARPPERKLERKETVVASPSVPARKYFVPQASPPLLWNRDPWDDEEEEPLGRW